MKVYFLKLFSLLVLIGWTELSIAQEMMAMVESNELEQKTEKVVDEKLKTNTEVPKKLTRKFKRDAARLALRMESKREDLRYLNIVIPRDNIESFYEVLTNIYVQNDVAKSIAKCNVHTFPNPSIDHLVIIFDRDVDWAAPLRDGISETDSDEINEMLDDYDLIIDKHIQWNDTKDAITIRSKAPLNMAALANEFYNIEGVSEIDLGIPEIGGNDINIERFSNGWEVQYVLRFGSYISGKGKLHIWRFKAYDDGTVEMLSEGGDPVPEWMRCEKDKKNESQGVYDGGTISRI